VAFIDHSLSEYFSNPGSVSIRLRKVLDAPMHELCYNRVGRWLW